MFVASCDEHQKQAVQHLIKIILQETKERNARNETRQDSEKNKYCLPLSKENYFGKRVLLLAEVFEVEIASE